MVRKLAISLITACSFLTLALPVSAGPAFTRVAPQTALGQATENVIEVQHRRNHRHHRLERRGGHTYYRGYRGSRSPKPGYRRHGNYWFPPAAFALGAIVGGAIASQPSARAERYDPHVAWCYEKYRSYRASDNTFQPYNGPRRPCRSPYR